MGPDTRRGETRLVAGLEAAAGPAEPVVAPPPSGGAPGAVPVVRDESLPPGVQFVTTGALDAPDYEFLRYAIPRTGMSDDDVRGLAEALEVHRRHQSGSPDRRLTYFEVVGICDEVTKAAKAVDANMAAVRGEMAKVPIAPGVGSALDCVAKSALLLEMMGQSLARLVRDERAERDERKVGV